MQAIQPFIVNRHFGSCRRPRNSTFKIINGCSPTELERPMRYGISETSPWESLRVCKTLLALLGLLWSLLARVVLESPVSPRRDAEQEGINFHCASFV